MPSGNPPCHHGINIWGHKTSECLPWCTRDKDMAAKKMSDHTVPEKKFKQTEMTADEIEKVLKANPALLASIGAATVKVTTIPPPGVHPIKTNPILFMPSQAMSSNPPSSVESIKKAIETITGRPWTEPSKPTKERPSRFEELDDE